MIKRMVLVDGYNLIRNDANLSAIEARSLEAGRRALVARLLSSFDLRHNDITVVFDGAGAPPSAPSSERHGAIRVLYSRRGETADAVIKNLIAAAPPGRPLVVLSDDRELRAAVQAQGGIAGGAADRARPRPTLSQSMVKDTDSEAPRRREKKGNPRRPKRHRRHPAGVHW